MTSEIDAIAAVDRPGTAVSLSADLQCLGLADGDIVIVHSSLSALGWVAGGPHAVTEALLATVGSSGTIVMPTQSGQLTDPATWSNPPVPAEWVSTIRTERPPYDPMVTPTRQMGQIVECFRRYPGTVRSAHPTMSFAANGPDAPRIIANHSLSPAFGEESPLARLYELDAKVLLLGVGHGNNTSLHLAEFRANLAHRSQRTDGQLVVIDGERRWEPYEDLDYDESDFDRLGAALADTGVEAVGPVANATGRLASQRAMVDFGVGWIETNRV